MAAIAGQPAPPRKILVIKLRALGDTVLMTAPLAEIHQAFPAAEIHVAVLTAWTPIIEGTPGVRKIWAFERHADTGSRAKAAARLAFKLRREKYDVVVNLHASPTSSLIAFATGAPVRAVHFHGHDDPNRYSTVEIPGKGQIKPIIERDMDALRGLGLKIPEGRLPRIHLKPGEVLAAGQRLEAQGLHAPVLGLGLGASRPSKCWPMANFAEIALRWARETGGGIYPIAGPEEGSLLAEFQSAVDRALEGQPAAERAELRRHVSPGERLGVRELAAVLNRCATVVGNDSGPRHLAVAVETPTVTVFGPEHPFEWHPYPPARHPYFFTENLPCRKDADPGMPAWCGVQVCHETSVEAHRCLTGIAPGPVLEEARRLADRAGGGS